MPDYASSRTGTNDLWEAMYTQRAIRYWEDRPVPDELLRRVVEAATRAPSGSNKQPWRFLVVRDAERRRRIAVALRGRTDMPEVWLERVRESGERMVRLMY